MLLVSPNTNIDEWTNRLGLEDLSAALRKACVMRKKSACKDSKAGCAADCTYTESWALRTLLVGRMRSKGIKRIKMPMAGQMSISVFQNMFPDERKWLTRFGWKDGQRTTLAGLFNRLGYTGPPELLSMWLCLLCNPAFDVISAKELELRKPALRAAMQQYRNDHGMWPHPLVLVKLVFG